MSTQTPSLASSHSTSEQQPAPVVIPQSPTSSPQLLSNRAPSLSLQQQHESTPVSTTLSSLSADPYEPVIKEDTDIKERYERKQAEFQAMMDAKEAKMKAIIDEQKAEMEALRKEKENYDKCMTASIINIQKQMWDADDKTFNSLQTYEDKYDYIKQRHAYYYRYKLALFKGGDGKKEKQALDEFCNYLKTTVFNKQEYESRKQQDIETTIKSSHDNQRTKRKLDDDQPLSTSKQQRHKTSAAKESKEHEQASSIYNTSTELTRTTKPTNRQLADEMSLSTKHDQRPNESAHDAHKEQKSSKPKSPQNTNCIKIQLTNGISGKEYPTSSKYHKDHNTFKMKMVIDPKQSIEDNIQSFLQVLIGKKILLQAPSTALSVSRLKFRLFHDNISNPHPVEIKSCDDLVYNNNETYLLAHDTTTTDDKDVSATLFIYQTQPTSSQFKFAYIDLTDDDSNRLNITYIHPIIKKIFKIDHKITYKQLDDTYVSTTTKESFTRIINTKKRQLSATPESSTNLPKKTKTYHHNDNNGSDQDTADDKEDKKVNIRLPHNIFNKFIYNNTNTKNSTDKKENLVGHIFGKIRENENKTYIDVIRLQANQSIDPTIITSTQHDTLVHVGNMCVEHPARQIVISQCTNQAIIPHFFTLAVTDNSGHVEYSIHSASDDVIQQYKGNFSKMPNHVSLTDHVDDDDDKFGIKLVDNVDILLSSSQDTTSTSLNGL